MKLTPTEIPGVVMVEPAVFGDERGWFMETFNEPRFHAELAKLGLPAPRPFVQDNHSCSRAGVLRGLHYQVPPHAQGKLVRVLPDWKAVGAFAETIYAIRPYSPHVPRAVAALVEELGGQLEINSIAGHGTSFTITLADQPPHEVEAQPAA